MSPALLNRLPRYPEIGLGLSGAPHSGVAREKWLTTHSGDLTRTWLGEVLTFIWRARWHAELIPSHFRFDRKPEPPTSTGRTGTAARRMRSGRFGRIGRSSRSPWPLASTCRSVSQEGWSPRLMASMPAAHSSLRVTWRTRPTKTGRSFVPGVRRTSTISRQLRRWKRASSQASSDIGSGTRTCRFPTRKGTTSAPPRVDTEQYQAIRRRDTKAIQGTTKKIPTEAIGCIFLAGQSAKQS